MTTQSDVRGSSSILHTPRALEVVCVILLLTLTGTLVWAFSLQGRLVENFQKEYPYIDIARHFIPQEHFVTTLQPLREELISISAKEPAGAVSVYVEYLNTGSNIRTTGSCQRPL
jgi:Tfp pilus assembly protein PilO